MIDALLSSAVQPLRQRPRFASFIDVIKADNRLLAPENRQLLTALYEPAPFPPPEIEHSEFSTQITYFLSFAGLASAGLAERASCVEQNQQSGLGIGIVKSAVTPYFTLPAALFFSSRLVRYGSARQDWPVG